MAAARGELSTDALSAIQDTDIQAAVASQESVGLEIVTDGELRRASWNTDFLGRLENVEIGARASDGRPRTEVVGRVTRTQSTTVPGFEFVRDLTAVPVKVTVPTPAYLLGTRGVYVEPAAYPDLESLSADMAGIYRAEIAALAEAGCRHLQIDDPNFGFFCDERWRRQAEEISGRSWQSMLDLYIATTNAALADRPPELTVYLHTCRGNLRDTVLAEGGYEPVGARLFEEVDVDAYLLEYDDARSGDFGPLRLLPAGKLAVLGLLTTRTGQLEDANAVKRRISEASRSVSLEQLALSPQCGFVSAMEPDRMTVDEQRAKLQLTVDIAAEIWG